MKHGDGGVGFVTVALIAVAVACIAVLIVPHVDTLMRAARVFVLMAQ